MSHYYYISRHALRRLLKPETIDLNTARKRSYIHTRANNLLTSYKSMNQEIIMPSTSSGESSASASATQSQKKVQDLTELLQFEDWEFDDDKQSEIKTKGQSSYELRQRKLDEELHKNKEIWKEIKKMDLGKSTFPDLKSCFPAAVAGEAEDSFKAFRNRPLMDVSAVFRHNAWDNIEWNDEMKAEAEKKIQNNSAVLLQDEKKEIYENEAPKFWDKFYGIHQNKFFRDRNWLFTEFPELQSPFGCSVDKKFAESELIAKRQNDESFSGENSRFRVLEIGCGNGSTVFPLLAMNNNPELFIYCCDFSATAVDVVKNSPKYEPLRCLAFVYDVTSDEDTPLPFPPCSLDVITLIFVLSAISPDKFEKVLSNLYKLLKPGGLILFRDYAKYDLVQLRLPQGRCISENFYVRGDGTCVYFFEQEEVENLFVKNGFTKDQIYVDRRLQVNRLKQLKMYRIWILGKFRKS